MKCNLCPRRCNAQRTESENLNGFCRMPLNPRVARADLHFWEEPPISGSKGSGTVFFSGCALNCVYCQNYGVSRENLGKDLSINELADLFKELENKGAHNINLVTPSHYVLAIKSALEIYKPNIPIVYNSSGYDSIEAFDLLNGLIDIYLLDLKYVTPDRGLKYSSAYDYPDVAKKAIIDAYNRQPRCVINSEGIMEKGLIIRHLLLPSGTNEAIKVFDWVRENTPDAYFSIMSQYLPMGDAPKYKEINRKVTKREYNKVLDYICSYDFDNIFIQDKLSADKDFIPKFNMRNN